MTFGAEAAEEFDPHDPFTLVKALKNHKMATKRMAEEVRLKVMHMSQQRAEQRRQQQQSRHVMTSRKIKGDQQMIRSTAPPSAASQFDVVVKDTRSPRPMHRGCKIQNVTEWAKSPRKSVDHDEPIQPLPPGSKPGRSPQTVALDGTVILVNSSSPNTQPVVVGGLRSSRGQGGTTTAQSGGTCGTLVPLHDGSHHLSLPSIDRMSPRVVGNAEEDFAVLSYGGTHAHASVFRELPEEYVFDLSGRRVPVVQFLKFFVRTGQVSLSFPAYIHLVYSHPYDESVLAVKNFSPRFGWAAQLSEGTAKLVASLWSRWTDDGNTPFTVDRFMEMHNVHQRSNRRYAELVDIFEANDHNEDGVFDKDEFSAFFSGGESANGVQKVATPTRDRSPPGSSRRGRRPSRSYA